MIPIDKLKKYEILAELDPAELKFLSAVPDSARVVQMVGNAEDPSNYLLMHAMAPNVAGVIGSAIAAGVLWSFIG